MHIKGLLGFVSVFSAACVTQNACATGFYWDKNADEGVFEDVERWYTTADCQTKSGACPGEGDVAYFGSGAHGTVTMGARLDGFTAPSLIWTAGADVTLLLPDCVVTTCKSTGDTAGNGFGVPWGMGSGLGRLTLAQGVLDLGNTEMSRNNAGTPQLSVCGATLRNCTNWRPAQMSTNFPLMITFGDGAHFESSKMSLPNVADASARAAFLVGDAGTVVSNVTVAFASDAFNGDVVVSNGATVVDSIFTGTPGATVAFKGPGTIVSNTIFRSYAKHSYAFGVDGVSWIGGYLLLSGEASNEQATNHVVTLSNAVFDGDFGFFDPGYGAESGFNKITIGPNAVIDTGLQKKFGNRTYSGPAFCGFNDHVRITGSSRLYVTNVAANSTALYVGVDKSTGASFTVDGGSKVVSRKFIYDAGGTNCTVTLDGAGTEYTITSDAPANGGPVTRFLYGGTAGTGNVFRVSNDAKFSILKDQDVSYDPNYDCGFCFTKGDHRNNRFEIDGATMTNDLSFYFGDNFYGGGQSNVLLLANNARYASPLDITMTPQYCQDNLLSVMDSELSVRYVKMKPGDTVRVGGASGGISAARLSNNSGTDGNNVRLEFVIPREGRDNAAYPGAYLVLGDNSRPLQDNSNTPAHMDDPMFSIHLDISDDWMSRKLKKTDYVDLISVPTVGAAGAVSRPKTILMNLMPKVSAADLKDCTLTIEDLENGTSVLRLHPNGKRGFLLVVR